MKRFMSEIIIDAPPQEVWTVLRGFESYDAWNPFLRRINGVVGPNQHLHIVAKLAWLPPFSFRARVERFEPCEALGWRAVFLPGLFEAHHWFELHPLDAGNRTRFVHFETFSGVFASPLLATLSNQFRQSYDAMNRALKRRVEQK